MVEVVWLEPGNQWDQHTFELLFNDYTHHKDFIEAEGVVLVVPHKYYIDRVDWLNQKIKQYKWVLYIGTGNEEGEFPLEKLEHPNMKIYYTTPHLKNTPMKLIDRLFGDGYAPQSEVVAEMTDLVMDKPLDVYFSGQITHKRRVQCIDVLKTMRSDKVEYMGTKGFTQGYDDPKEYYKKMASAKIIPCPSGPATQDTFRSYEALQCMSLPIVDSRTPLDENPTDYWDILFGETPPFPIIRDDWQSLPGYTKDSLKDWPRNINRAVAWWIAKKRQYACELIDDLNKLTGQHNKGDELKDKITIVIPTSPISSHPDTSILDETIKSVRHHLPDSEIILTFDGVREEQEKLRNAYEEYIYRVLWKCLHEWENVLPVIFDRHTHQVGMLRVAINYIKTPLVLYVEMDTPLVFDREIDWNYCSGKILDGTSNLIRFHHEAVIPKDHDYLMLGREDKLIKTAQWSQRPHLASVAFYKRILSGHFSQDAKSFVEDLFHGILLEVYKIDGEPGWQQYKVHIFAPEDNLKYSYHTDARKGEEKYVSSQTF